MTKATWLFRDSQAPSWTSEHRTDVPAELPSHRPWSLTNTFLFWYLNHVERTIKNNNSISADLMEDTNETDYLLFLCNLPFVSKRNNIRTLSVNMKVICICCKTTRKSSTKTRLPTCYI